MTNDLAKDVVEAIRALYSSDERAQALFDALAKRRRDASATSIDNLSNTLNIARGDAVALARALEETGCGQFIVGRRGQRSRFEWEYSCISLGRAAAGESADLEKAVDPVPEVDEEPQQSEVGIVPNQPSPAMKPVTIPEAKQLLAFSLGVSIANIEITVKV